MDELDDGKTLARVIEVSRSTLVVLDRDRAAPFARLWCADKLYYGFRLMCKSNDFSHFAQVPL